MPRLYSFSTVSLKGPALGPIGILPSSVWEYVKDGDFASLTPSAVYASELNITVLVGNGGYIAVTTDGREYYVRDCPTTQNLLDVAYGPGIGFVAVGVLGTLLFSSNGSSWITRTSPVATNLIGCTYANGLFVIVGSFGNIWTSTDTINWTKSDTGNTTSQIWGIAWNGTRWYTSGNLILTSTSPTAASGTWTAGADPGPTSCYRIEATTSGRFIASGTAGRLVVSDTTGSTWTSYDQSSTKILYGLSVATINGVETAVTVNYDSATTSNSISYATASNNFSTWTNITPGVPGLSTIIFDDKCFLAFGSNNDCVASSSNVTSWSTRSTGLDIYGIDYSTTLGLYVAAGRYSSISNQGGLFYSSDGYSWTRASGFTGGLNVVKWLPEAGQFFAAGANGITRTSTNATSWSIVQFPNSSAVHNSVAYNHGSTTWAVCSNGGKIYSTTTPSTQSSWIDRTGSLTPNNLKSIIFNKLTSTWVCVGDSGTVLFSTNNANNWSFDANFPSGGPNLNSITFAKTLPASESKHVIVGNAGTIYISDKDRSFWTQIDSGVTNDLLSVEWDYRNNIFIAVGSGEIILEGDSTGTVWTVASKTPQRVINSTSNSLRTIALGTFENQYLAGGSNNLLIKKDIDEIPKIGDYIEGGYYAGNIKVNNVEYAVIMAPKSGGESPTTLAWQTNRSDTVPTGSMTINNGASATSALAAVGSPAATFCNNLILNGYTDWYLPSRDELELLCRNFRPSDSLGNYSSQRSISSFTYPEGDGGTEVGLNMNSRPNGLPYKIASAPVTALDDFKEGGSEALNPSAVYWSSSGFDNSIETDVAWFQIPGTGQQGKFFKDFNGRVRAVRRVALPLIPQLVLNPSQIQVFSGRGFEYAESTVIINSDGTMVFSVNNDNTGSTASTGSWTTRSWPNIGEKYEFRLVISSLSFTGANGQFIVDGTNYTSPTTTAWIPLNGDKLITASFSGSVSSVTATGTMEVRRIGSTDFYPEVSVRNFDIRAEAATVSVSSSSSSMNEGTGMIFNVTTVGVPNSTTLYFTTTDAQPEDFALSTGSFTVSGGSASFSVTVVSDSTTEGSEAFAVQIRSGSTSGPVLATSNYVTINDTSVASSYSISTANSYTDVDEGFPLTFNVTSSGAPDGTQLYWTVDRPEDFNPNSGNMLISGNSASFSVTPTSDGNVESAETFTASVRTDSVSGNIVATSTSISINNAYAYAKQLTGIGLNNPMGALNNNGRLFYAANGVSNISSNQSLIMFVHDAQGVEQLGYRTNFFNPGETPVNRSCFVTSANNFVVTGDITLSGSPTSIFLVEANSTSNVHSRRILSHSTYGLTNAISCRGSGDAVYVAAETSAPTGTPGLALFKLDGPVPTTGTGSSSILWAKKIVPFTGTDFSLRTIHWNSATDEVFLTYKCSNHSFSTAVRNGRTPVIIKFNSSGTATQWQDLTRNSDTATISIEDQELELSANNSSGNFYCNIWTDFTDYTAGQEMKYNRVPNTMDVFGNFGWFDSPGWSRYSFWRNSTSTTKLNYVPRRTFLLEESNGTTGSGTVVFVSEMGDPVLGSFYTKTLIHGVDDFDGRNKFSYIMGSSFGSGLYNYEVETPTRWSVFQQANNLSRLAMVGYRYTGDAGPIPYKTSIIKVLPVFQAGTISFDYLSVQRDRGPYGDLTYSPIQMRVSNRTFSRSDFPPTISDIPLNQLTISSRGTTTSSVTDITRSSIYSI